MHISNGEAARQAKKLAPFSAVGADFDSRVRAAIRKELALQPKSHLEAAGGCKKQPGSGHGKGDYNFNKYKGWTCGGRAGCGFEQNSSSDDVCCNCQKAWGHWRNLDYKAEASSGQAQGKPGPPSPMAPWRQQRASSRAWKKTRADKGETEGASPTSAASQDMDVEQGPALLDFEKLKLAHQAMAEAFGADSKEANDINEQVDLAFAARRAATPTHILLLKVERKISAIENKIEQVHQNLDALEQVAAELEQKRQKAMQHGRSLQTSLEALRAERAATLAQGQTRSGAGNQQADLFMALGLGVEFAQQHPGLEDLLAQVQGLVAQIKSQAQHEGATQPGVPATLVDSPTQEPSGHCTRASRWEDHAATWAKERRGGDQGGPWTDTKGQVQNTYKVQSRRCGVLSQRSGT